MKRTIKTILVLMAGVIAATACNKELNSSLLPPFVGNNEIAFSSRGILVETKSFTETTNDILKANGFKAAAVISTDNSVMFNNATKYNTTDQVYRVHNGTSEEHYYYPNTGTMSFYAVYPATQAITVSNGVATAAYTQNGDTDLIAAKATGVEKSSNAVQLDFSHILSQVSMTAKTDDENLVCKLYSLTINDANGGTYSFANDAWTLSTTKADYSFFSSTDGVAVTTTAGSVGSAMSFMPGTITLNAKWKCYNKVGNQLISDNDETVSVTLTKGMHTTLNLTLPANSSEITFTTTVATWSTEGKDVKMETPTTT